MNRLRQAKIKRIARNVRRRIMRRVGRIGGQCYDASLLLVEELSNNGIKAWLMRGQIVTDPHYWVMVEDYIVDVTADQFNAMRHRTGQSRRKPKFPAVLLAYKQSCHHHMNEQVVNSML